MKMTLFIIKATVRFLGILSLAVILPFAVNNPAIEIEKQWLIWVAGAILALNIVFNDPYLTK